MATPVVSDHAESILGEEQHLAVPRIRIQRPSVRKRYDRALAPVLVVEGRTILHRNRAHMDFPPLIFVKELLALCGSTWRAPTAERPCPSRRTRRISPVW